MEHQLRNAALDPRERADEAAWSIESHAQLPAHLDALSGRFLGMLFMRFPALLNDAVFMRYTQQPEDVWVLIDREHAGFGIQIDPVLDVIVVWNERGQQEFGSWHTDLVDAAITAIAAQHLAS